MTEVFLRIHDVESRTGLRKSHLYALASQGNFPAPLKISGRASAWIESEVLEWVVKRIRASGRRTPDAVSAAVEP